MPVVVCINQFPQDTPAELAAVKKACEERGVEVVLSDVWGTGGAGGVELAQKVVELADTQSDITFAYETNLSLVEKIETIAKKIYGAKGVEFTPQAKRELAKLAELGFSDYPICMAKTQYSFSDNPNLLGAPKDFTITIRSVKVSAGAGFIVALTGNIMTMPGLPKKPAAENIDVDEFGNITGLF